MATQDLQTGLHSQPIKPRRGLSSRASALLIRIHQQGRLFFRVTSALAQASSTSTSASRKYLVSASGVARLPLLRPLTVVARALRSEMIALKAAAVARQREAAAKAASLDRSRAALQPAV